MAETSETCLLAFPDRLRPSSVVTPVLSGGSWLASLPLTNLQDPDIYRPARSSNALAASTQYDFDLGTERDIRVLLTKRHNFSLDATVRYRFWLDAGHTQLVHDTGYIPAWLPFYPTGSLPWGHPSLWDGKISVEDQAGYKFDFIHVLPASIVARYGRREVVDTTNPAGYVEMTRDIYAPAWAPPENMQYGATVGYKSDAQKEKPPGGKRYIDEWDIWRVAHFTLAGLSPGQARACVLDMQRRLGQSGELVFIEDPAADSQAMQQGSFLCTMEELNPIVWPRFQENTAEFLLEEIV